MSILFLIAALVGAEPESESDQQRLLQTFRSEFIAITPGRGKYPRGFQMGRAVGGPEDERPVHRVEFSYDFEVAKYEVPQNLWETVMGSNPSRWKGPRNSVENLSFREAEAFCQRVTELMQASKLIEGNQVVRLPSEAEWEFVARAGTTGDYSFGAEATELAKYGWFTGNARGNDPPVGAKLPNPWGLYDIHGYLWEWCSDSWHPDYVRAPSDGSAWSADGDPSPAVARGGSWKDQANRLTSSARRPLAKTARDDAVGLRCVLSAR